MSPRTSIRLDRNLGTAPNEPSGERSRRQAGESVARQSLAEQGSGTTWERILRERLALYGHRNWVVIADSAYPAQARAGIETICVDADLTSVLKTVLAAIAASPHVSPVIYSDAELQFVVEDDAPGISEFRRALAALIGTEAVRTLPHEQIIATLDAAAQTFCVLILKTRMVRPYTSVFVELNCGYWSAEAETRLRNAIAGTKP